MHVVAEAIEIGLKFFRLKISYDQVLDKLREIVLFSNSVPLIFDGKEIVLVDSPVKETYRCMIDVK